MQEGEISTERQTENQTAKQPELQPEHQQNNENKLLKFVKKTRCVASRFVLLSLRRSSFRRIKNISAISILKRLHVCFPCRRRCAR